MADRTIGELDPVKEVPIGDLPQVLEIYDDSLLPVEQQGVAMRMTGKQFREFGEKTAEIYVQTAVDAAESAKETLGQVEQAGEDALESVQQAETDALTNIEDKRQAVVEEMTELRDTTEGYKDEAAQSATDAAASANEAKKSKDAAAASQTAAKTSEGVAENWSKASQSWAVGGTGSRVDEDTNNSKYWADKAQAEAERATVPPVEGVYNIILTDRNTEDRYALIVEDGRLILLSVSKDFEATDLVLLDRVTSQGWTLAVESGRLLIEEVA